jgi:hypothetical protein
VNASPCSAMPAAIAATRSSDSYSPRRQRGETLEVVDGPLLRPRFGRRGKHRLDCLVQLVGGLIRVDPFAMWTAVVVCSQASSVDAGCRAYGRCLRESCRPWCARGVRQHPQIPRWTRRAYPIGRLARTIGYVRALPGSSPAALSSRHQSCDTTAPGGTLIVFPMPLRLRDYIYLDDGRSDDLRDAAAAASAGRELRPRCDGLRRTSAESSTPDAERSQQLSGDGGPCRGASCSAAQSNRHLSVAQNRISERARAATGSGAAHASLYRSSLAALPRS